MKVVYDPINKKNTNRNLTFYKTYKVLEIRNEFLYLLVNDDGRLSYYSMYYFKEIENVRDEKIIEVLSL